MIMRGTTIVYKYEMNMDTKEFSVIPYEAKVYDYKTHIAYTLKKHNTIFNRRLNLEVVKCKNKLIAWSLDGDKLNEFKLNCAKKIEHFIHYYTKHFEGLAEMEKSLNNLKKVKEVIENGS